MQALTFWEIATEVILERESLMTKLEDFERTASDPNRFFAKGNHNFNLQETFHYLRYFDKCHNEKSGCSEFWYSIRSTEILQVVCVLEDRRGRKWKMQTVIMLIRSKLNNDQEEKCTRFLNKPAHVLTTVGDVNVSFVNPR